MRNVLAIFGILAMSLTAMADDQTKTQAAGWIVKATSVNEAMAEFTLNCAKTANANSGILTGISNIKVVNSGTAGLVVTGNCIYEVQTQQKL